MNSLSGGPEPAYDHAVDVEVKVVGEPEIVVDGRRIAIVGDRLQAFFVALAMDADEPVPMVTLIERMWPDGPPANPRRAVQAVAMRLRHLLGAPDLISTEPSGYRLRVPRANVDALAVRVPRQRGPSQLPSDLPDFVGRAAQVSELTGSDARVLVLSGPPGVGKTALAVHTAHRLRARFPDGSLYGDLRAYAPGAPVAPEQVLSRFLRALGTPPEAIPVRLEDQVRAYREALADRQVLVVLDNATEAALRSLRQDLPGCLTLVTSRHDLAALPDVHQVELGELADAEALELLGGMLGKDLVDDVPEAVDELVRLCARLPLALRIAGANLAGRYPADVVDYAEELGGDRLGALSVDGDVAVQRAFDLSYRALPEEARRLFRRLGHVPGPDFGVLTATAVLGADALGPLDVLVRANLVQHAAPGRYLLHDLLRVYAAGMADPDPLGDYFDVLLHTTQAAGRVLNPELHRHELPETTVDIPSFDAPDEALAWFDAERAGLVATVEQAVRLGRPEATWLLTDMVRGYLFFQGHLADWFATLRPALSAAVAAGDEAGEMLMRRGLSLALRRTGDLAGGAAEAAKALDLARTGGTPADVAAMLSNVGIMHWELGQLDLAAAEFREGLDRYAALGVGGPTVAPIMFNLGAIHLELGPLERAVHYTEQVLKLSEESGMLHGQALCKSHLGDAHHLVGEVRAAKSYLAEALDLILRIHAGPEALRRAVDTMAEVDLDLGLLDEALSGAERVLELAMEASDRQGEVNGHLVLGRVHGVRGSLSAAVERHRTALEISRETGYLRGEVNARIGLAESYRVMGELDEALSQCQAADAVVLGAQLRVPRGRVLIQLAATHLARGSLDDAVSVGLESLAVQRETGQRLGEARTLAGLAAAHRALGDEPAALEHWTAALEIFDDLNPVEAAKVRGQLAG